MYIYIYDVGESLGPTITAQHVYRKLGQLLAKLLAAQDRLMAPPNDRRKGDFSGSSLDVRPRYRKLVIKNHDTSCFFWHTPIYIDIYVFYIYYYILHSYCIHTHTYIYI